VGVSSGSVAAAGTSTDVCWQARVRPPKAAGNTADDGGWCLGRRSQRRPAASAAAAGVIGRGAGDSGGRCLGILVASGVGAGVVDCSRRGHGP